MGAAYSQDQRDRVLAAADRFLPTHVEVDRSPELADTFLGTRAIPMTHALRDRQIVA